MIQWNAILFFILTLVLMAFFAGIEMAYYSANRLSLELKKKQGGANAQRLTKFIDSPARFLGTTLIGYTIFLVFLGLQFSVVMRPIWSYLHVGSDTVHLVVEIAFTTLIVLVFAEYIPRAWFRAKSNSWLAGLSPVIDFFYGLFSPIATSLIDLSEWILKYVMNIRLDKNKEGFTRSDLKNLFLIKSEDERQERNTQLMENAQELPRVKIRQCLVPRKEITGIESSASVDEMKAKFIDTKLSKLVVYENNIDHIIGYVHQLDLFKKPAAIKDILLPIPAVPESMSASDLISKFTRDRKSIAWVVDEFGGTAGIITMEDLMEEIFGDIQDEHDDEELIEKKISDNEFEFSGRLEIDYLNRAYNLKIPEDDYNTLSGYIISSNEDIPEPGTTIEADRFRIKILKATGIKIELVNLKVREESR